MNSEKLEKKGIIIVSVSNLNSAIRAAPKKNKCFRQGI
jgi:hypothetical protein